MESISINSPATVILKIRAVVDHPLRSAPGPWTRGDGQEVELRFATEDDLRWTSDEPRDAELYSAAAPRGHRPVVMLLSRQVGMTRAVASALHAMAADRRPAESAPLEESDHATYGSTVARHVRRDEHIGWSWPTPHHHLPSAVGSGLLKAFEEMRDALRRAWRVIRWRHALGGRVSPLTIFGFEASFDGITWFPLSVPEERGHSLPASTTRPVEIAADDAGLAHALLDGTDEPTTAHMLVEAFGSLEESPQSALLIGIAAVETAAKEFIVKKCPRLEPLVMKMPSPPLLQLITDVIPPLLGETGSPRDLAIPRDHTRKEGYADAVLRALDNGVSMRNSVSHRGTPVSADKVGRVLLAASDVMYLLEHYAGASWASGMIRPEVRTAWEAAAQTDTTA